MYLVTAQGALTGTTFPLPVNGPLQVVFTGYFIVSQAGNIVFNLRPYDDIIIGIGNALSGGGSVSAVSTNFYPGVFSGTTTPYMGYPLMFVTNAARHSSAPDNCDYGTLNFSAPGIYPFEIDYNGGGDGNVMNVYYNGGNSRGPSGFLIPPISVVTAPPQPSPGTQNLILTPTGGNSNLVLQGSQVTLNLALTATFVTQPYIPILEGGIGQVYIYNDPINPTFTFPTYYGATPDGPSASVDDFLVIGDNTAWQGQVALRWDAALSRFELYYNGSQSLASNQLLAPNVQSTTLTITQEDIAWFDASGPEYDVFQATSQGGGKFANIAVYYQLNPNYPTGAAVQVSPTTVVQDGTAKTFTVTLARPLPPSQNNTVMGVAFSGTQPVPGSVTVTPNLGTIASIPNWLVSYTVTATWASAAVASTSTMSFAFDAPSITFLGGVSIGGAAVDAFSTLTDYAYQGTAPSQAITLQAGNAQTPYNVSLQEFNGSTPLSETKIGNTTTLVATWVSYSNDFSTTSFYIVKSGQTSPPTLLGSVLASSAVITSIGGGAYQAVYTLTASTSQFNLLVETSTYNFGFQGTTTDNNNPPYYLDTNAYESEHFI